MRTPHSSLTRSIDDNAPIVGSSFAKSTEYLKSIVEISSTDFPYSNQENDVDELRGIIIGVLDAAVVARDGIASYMSSLSGIPRITKEMNSARRRLAASSDMYFDMLSGVVIDIESMLSILNNAGKT